MQALEMAEKNCESHLRQNPYPGRGLVIGRSSVNDEWLMIYWIMGRSENSRNRRFVAAGGVLKTEPVDLSRVKDPSLIIYEAMLELPGVFSDRPKRHELYAHGKKMSLPGIYLMSNGAQTRGLCEALQKGGGFDDEMAKWEREPDAPNFTPRITGMLELHGEHATITLSILKANPADPGLTDRTTIRPALPPAGLGLGITTYRGDGNPLPCFQGDPLLLPCNRDAAGVLDMYWDAPNADNRISLAVKRISARGGPGEILIRNRFGA